MKEHEARRAVLKRQDLTDGDKVVLMAILMTMDWDSWTNRTSFKAIANLTGKRRSSISRNIRRIEKLGYIKRDFMSAEYKEYNIDKPRSRGKDMMPATIKGYDQGRDIGVDG